MLKKSVCRWFDQISQPGLKGTTWFKEIIAWKKERFIAILTGFFLFNW